MYSLFQFLLLLPLVVITVACSSTGKVSSDYQQAVSEQRIKTSGRTVIFFLVDGLSLKSAKTALNTGQLPNIYNFFIAQNKRMYVARTTFPSLTYPAIGALLTESTVDQNGILGNKSVHNNELVNFEKPKHYSALNKFVENKNIFSRLQSKGLKSVSLDYAFHGTSTAYRHAHDTKTGVAILNKDYEYIDNKTIQSLIEILDENPIESWPDFIFVHLVGNDFINHDEGPFSQTAQDYLQALDRKLSGVFEILKKAEKQKKRQVVSFLSSDHGFDNKVTQSVDIEKVFNHINKDITVINEGRYAALYFPENINSGQKISLLESLNQHQIIDIVTYREEQNIFIKSKTHNVVATYAKKSCRESDFAINVQGQGFLCPENFNSSTNTLFYPFFIANISYYFNSASHPDAVIIPRTGFSFKNDYLGRGQHGGPTAQEVFVPLLIHNGTLKNFDAIPGLWELLRFM